VSNYIAVYRESMDVTGSRQDSRVVLLAPIHLRSSKHEISTPRQIRNYVSIGFKFSANDHVYKCTDPSKFGSYPIRRKYPTGDDDI